MSANRLIEEKSPYLLQHAYNPVDWFPWGDEAFERARRQNKPVFLSIGYATCHWCHVMEKESFEDKEAAARLNDTFICIKVDREERPDIDAVYMAACQMLTGGGGWPLTVILTPDKKPFFAGTYFPKQSRFGRIGLIDLCRRIKDMWQTRTGEIHTSADSISTGLGQAFTFESHDAPIEERLLDQAYFMLEGGYDERFGGFESAPKFPTPHRLMFLLRCHSRSSQNRALEMVEKTLTAMRIGGIWDHVGFGFHRYATDRQWLLPHFEKMLYDQALMALPLLEAFQITQKPLYAQTVHEIFAYVLRDMTDENGGFYSAEDADSEGVEGKFYVWPAEEFGRVVSVDSDDWARLFNVQSEGNFQEEATGHQSDANILHISGALGSLAETGEIMPPALAGHWESVREALFAARKQRVHPLKDDKILTDWNGLMVAALSRGGRVLKDDRYVAAAKRAADFILTRMRGSDGRLMHRYRKRDLAIAGQAADYAYMIFGLLELYQSTFDTVFLKEAIALQTVMLEDFWDEANGGFYLTAKNAVDLPVRPKEIYDGAVPSSNSVSLTNLLILFRLTGDSNWEQLADRLVSAFAGTVKKGSTAFTFFLCGLDFALRPNQEIVITGEPEATETLDLLSALNQQYAPHRVTQLKTDRNASQLANLAGYTDGLEVIEGQTTAHMCKGFACQESTTDLTAVLRSIQK